MPKTDNPHAGHRQRLRDEYAQKGLDHMPVHRVLEMLLHFAIPQRDTNELAHQLIDIFGSFAQVFAADIETLAAVKGMTYNAAVLIHMVPEVSRRVIEDQLNREWVLDSDRAAADYLLRRFRDRTKETVMVLCLDNSSRLSSCRIISEGDPSSVRLDIRRICETALQCGSTRIILAHNHPGGRTEASLQDIRETERLVLVLQALNIRLLDHFIVNEIECESMARMGYIGLEHW